MPYKDKEKQKLAVKKSMRKNRGVDAVSDVAVSYETVNPEEVALIVETILSTRPAVVPDAIYKMFNELKSAVDVLTGRIAELENGDNVDFSRLKKSGKSDSVATETGLCPKHKRIRIPGRPSCC